MKILVLMMLLAAAPVSAFDWPWQSQPKENYSYCKGFISSGLAAFPVKGLSRTKLWLNWNHTIQARMATTGPGDTRYSEGRSRFESLLASNDNTAVIDIANGECDLGES